MRPKKSRIVAAGRLILILATIFPAVCCFAYISQRYQHDWFPFLAVAGALGCNLGSLVAYEVGARGGRPLVERYGRYVLVSRHDLALAAGQRPDGGDDVEVRGCPVVQRGG